MGDDDNDPSGCWAYVGRQGAQGGKQGQTVNLGSPDCFNIGTIVHEILHTLGGDKNFLSSLLAKIIRCYT